MTDGMKRCATCREFSPYDAKWCIICGEAYPGYTGGTKRLGDIILGDKVAGDVIYGNKLEYGSNKERYISRWLLSSGVPPSTMASAVPLGPTLANQRLKITGAQYWEFLSKYELGFDLHTGEILLYGYPVDIDW